MAAPRTTAVALAALVFLVVAASFASVARSEPLAIVAAVRGRVEFTPAAGGAPARASFGQALERGDRVSVGPGGAATIFFDGGSVIELAEKSAIVIGGRASAKPKAARVGLPGEVYASVSKFVTGGSRESGLVALSVLRGGTDATPLLVEPRRTEILDLRPSFRWRSVEGAARYRIAVSGDSGELWSRETEGTVLEYPPDAAALAAAGAYAWEVRAFSDRGELRREDSFFHVLEAGEAAAVRGALAKIRDAAGGPGAAAARFLAGSYLFGRGLYGDAAAEFDSLARSSPDVPAPHEALGNVYRAIGLMDQAAAEYQQALTLSKQH
ncbi:MAG TPA: hypothetical protein VMS88_06195 [Terriglobales bacterium]|nr:hypothetical protein [Terriglobales bacterium]